MGTLWKMAKQIAVSTALWAMVAGIAAAQEAVATPPPTAPVPAVAPAEVGGPNPTPRQVPCREAGDSCPPNLALDPDHWPPTSWGVPYDQFDPLKSQCPSKDDYFILPPRNCWYFRLEGGAMRRMPTHSVDFAAEQPLLQTSPTQTTYGSPDIVLSTSDFNYDFGATGQFLIGRTLSDNLQIEGVFTGIEAAENTQSARDNTPNVYGGSGNLFSPFSDFGGQYGVGIPGLDFNRYATVSYVSSLTSAEVNFRRLLPMPPEQLTVSVLFGVRYIGLPEDLYYHTESDVASDTNLTGSANTIHVATQSTQWGPQIGACFEFYVENRWWVDFEMKAAILNNNSQETSTYTNVDGANGTHVYTSQDSGNHTSFAGDLNLSCVYRWSPHLMTRIGYHALFLTGQTLAQDNFTNNINYYTNSATQLNHNSNIVYQGPFAGIEFGW